LFSVYNLVPINGVENVLLRGHMQRPLDAKEMLLRRAYGRMANIPADIGGSSREFYCKGPAKNPRYFIMR
jgi:hypothetical protein